jgi:DNA-binding XRE family transcriptional regulator
MLATPRGECGRQHARDGLFNIWHTDILCVEIGFVDIGFSDCLRAFDPEPPPLWIDPEQHKIVGACLAAARRKASLTQKELAEKLGKPQSFVSEYERGQRRVDVVELLAISRALDADPIDLFCTIAARTTGRPTAGPISA